VKLEAGLDLAGKDANPILDFATDPDAVMTVSYYLFKDQFEKADISEDQLAEMCGVKEIDSLREEVVEQMRSFSIFWKILSTEMENLQSGNISPLMEKMANKTETEGSGLSS
jgi:regulator of RNase E activity RraB